MRNNRQVGTHGELEVAARMSRLGFSISLPIGEEPYDLIAEKEGRCIRVQVKTANINKGGSYRVCLCFGNEVARHYSSAKCDAVVMYAPYSVDFEGIHEDGFYVIPVKDVERKKKYHATIFPAGMGKGNSRSCAWEKYRDAWSTI